MSESVHGTESAGPRKARVIGAALEVAALGLGLFALVWAIVQLWAIWGAGTELPAEVSAAAAGFSWYLTVNVVALLLAAWGGALALWALGEAVRQLDNIQLVLAAESPEEQIVLQPQPAPVSAPARRSRDGVELALGQLRDLLVDIRNLTLLSEEQRAKRFEVQGQALLHELAGEVPQLLREHKFVQARRRLADARERFPTLPEWDELDLQIEQAREKIEAHDIENATRQISDLATLGAWDRAINIVRDLVQRHPASKKVEELAHRITAQRAKAQQDERARLLAQAQTATDRKDWHEALDLTNLLIERYPDAAETEALRQQLPTLRDNVEIQQRQRMEGQIRDLIREQHFAEALAIARQLISKYPTSPQAAVLREQLPRLQERAAAAAHV